MKWFQVDSDTPHDPKVKAVLREMGVGGVGGLFLLWCHIADHGIRKPGWSLDSSGRPMPEPELVIASELSHAEFLKLVTICTETGHFNSKEWQRRRVIAIPAMASRADTYTKRSVRTHVEHASKKVRQSSSTTQHKTNKQEPPVVPLKGGRRRRSRPMVGADASRVCQHEPKCRSFSDCRSKTLAEARKEAS